MLSILDRYFLRELAQTVAATAVVLLVIVAGTAFAKVLQEVANGSFPPSVMFQVLGLQTLDGLTNLLPLASFIGVLMGLGRMYRESEMHVLASSGMGPRGLLRPVLIMGAVLVLITALVSLWLGPWAVRTSDALVTSANRSVIAAGLEAGRFTNLPGKGGIIFVDNLSRDGSQLGHTFVATQTAPKDGPPSLKIVNAASGSLYQESNGEGRFIAFKDGWQYEIPLGADSWRQMQYQRNDTSLSSVQADDDDDPAHSKASWTLARSDDPDDRAEFAWRINAPPLTLVLLLLALPLSRQSPREPRYGRLLLAIVSFYLYYTLLALGRAQIGKGHWHNAAPLWALHVLVLFLAGWMLWKQYSPRKTPHCSGGADVRRSIADMMSIKRVDRLVAISVLGSLLMVWLVLTGFDAITQFLRQLSHVGKNGFTLGNAVVYVLVTFPRRAYEMFGNAALIGGLLGLGGLAGTGELTALRAAGMSRLRVAGSAAGVVLVLIVGVVILGETAAPWGDQQAQAMQLRMKSGSLGMGTDSGLWARDGNSIINARGTSLQQKNGVGTVQLSDVRVFTFAKDGQITRFQWAKNAVHNGHTWVLKGVRSTTLDAHGTHSRRIASQSWQSSLNPQVLAQSVIQPRYLSMRDLRRNINYLEGNGQSPGSYAVAFWGRALYPLNVLVLVLCTMPFAFGALRSGGLGKRMFIGILLALAWYFLQQAIVNFGTVYGLSPLLANLLPALLLVIVAWLYFRRRI